MIATKNAVVRRFTKRIKDLNSGSTLLVRIGSRLGITTMHGDVQLFDGGWYSGMGSTNDTEVEILQPGESVTLEQIDGEYGVGAEIGN